MPRKSRIEYPGAVYHIFSRGNYRKALFDVPGSGASFESTMFEAAERFRWRILAYTIMSNHYHMALETPEANLTAGMQWLQSTFAMRFNRFHDERGHVFQGRYKAILVEAGRPLLGLINYIHLNPVRAGLCTIETLRRRPLSSYFHYWRKDDPACLCREAVLTLAELPNTTAGMQAYETLLASRDEANPRKRAELHALYQRGWFLGSKESKRQLVRDLTAIDPRTAWTGRERREMNEEAWDLIVQKEMRRLKKTEADIQRDPKGAPWKATVAAVLRHLHNASNPWIAQRLNMGHPTRVSMATSKAMRIL
ncbi:MAG TPA: transposase [Kiritimatiellia bacterium]|nr:transposase [Kiritimatiellia bacterium]HMP33296.1 transposase [Kiritimatiellia bacterium]